VIAPLGVTYAPQYSRRSVFSLVGRMVHIKYGMAMPGIDVGRDSRG
jgi:hypothetical protein